MGLFRRRTEIDPAALERMRSEITSLRDAINAHDDRRTAESSPAADSRPDPHERLDELTSKLTDLESKTSVAPPTQAPDHGPEIEELRAKLAELEEDVAAARDVPVPGPRLDELAAQLAALDARVSAVSTELTNQLTELGHDIDALANLPSNARAAIEESVLADLRDSQSRLANEQARYQIAFREDLARIAEQFRRPAK